MPWLHGHRNNFLCIALIDFGQAFDTRDLAIEELFKRDVTRVKQFIDKMGITNQGHPAALSGYDTVIVGS